MRILKVLFGNKELDLAFIDNRTTFVLSSYVEEGSDVFQKTLFKLIKKVKFKGEFFYLIETEQSFTGLDFGMNAIKINRFVMAIRRPSSFEINSKNDVIIYLPKDVDNLFNSENCLNDLEVVNWAYINNIRN